MFEKLTEFINEKENGLKLLINCAIASELINENGKIDLVKELNTNQRFKSVKHSIKTLLKAQSFDYYRDEFNYMICDCSEDENNKTLIIAFKGITSMLRGDYKHCIFLELIPIYYFVDLIVNENYDLVLTGYGSGAYTAQSFAEELIYQMKNTHNSDKKHKCFYIGFNPFFKKSDINVNYNKKEGKIEIYNEDLLKSIKDFSELEKLEKYSSNEHDRFCRDVTSLDMINTYYYINDKELNYSIKNLNYQSIDDGAYHQKCNKLFDDFFNFCKTLNVLNNSNINVEYEKKYNIPEALEKINEINDLINCYTVKIINNGDQSLIFLLIKIDNNGMPFLKNATLNLMINKKKIITKQVKNFVHSINTNDIRNCLNEDIELSYKVYSHFNEIPLSFNIKRKDFEQNLNIKTATIESLSINDLHLNAILYIKIFKNLEEYNDKCTTLEKITNDIDSLLNLNYSSSFVTNDTLKLDRLYDFRYLMDIDYLYLHEMKMGITQNLLNKIFKNESKNNKYYGCYETLYLFIEKYIYGKNFQKQEKDEMSELFKLERKMRDILLSNFLFGVIGDKSSISTFVERVANQTKNNSSVLCPLNEMNAYKVTDSIFLIDYPHIESIKQDYILKFLVSRKLLDYTFVVFNVLKPSDIHTEILVDLIKFSNDRYTILLNLIDTLLDDAYIDQINNIIFGELKIKPEKIIFTSLKAKLKPETIDRMKTTIILSDNEFKNKIHEIMLNQIPNNEIYEHIRDKLLKY